MAVSSPRLKDVVQSVFWSSLPHCQAEQLVPAAISQRGLAHTVELLAIFSAPIAVTGRDLPIVVA